MTSTDFNPSPQWQSPNGTRTQNDDPKVESYLTVTCALGEEYFYDQKGHTQLNEGPHGTNGEQIPNSSSRHNRQHWSPRTCRICLDVVQPTFHPPLENLPGMFQHHPFVSYESSDPDVGRLLRPCKCKGSSKYVHEGCLQAWRHADPGYGKRNYWQCPTCGFKYRLERMQWGRWISSTATQIFLTVSIFITALFIMGFVADPIINLYFDPYSIIPSTRFAKVDNDINGFFTDGGSPTWSEHFFKGLASLGLLGFIKVILAASPWNWFNMRNTGIMGGRGRSNTGRDRVASVSWIVIIIGVGTFLWAVYKGVRAWSRRTLERAGEQVMDVTVDDDDDDED